MSTPPLLVQRLPINRRGRCFVVTDVHFQLKKLMEGLALLNFDPSVDRLIIGGDLVDRGPDWREALALLDKAYVWLVRGNHEQMIIDAWKERRAYSSNGASWWMTLADESQDMVARKFDALPYAIEIESERGLVGVVHANVPDGMDWSTFIERLSFQGIQEKALWQRERVTGHRRGGVDGIWRACIGHTYLPFPQRLGNVLALDCTTGNGSALAIYCIQDDTIYVDGVPALFEDLPKIRGHLSSQQGDPLPISQLLGGVDRIEADAHELLAMNNALMGMLFEEPRDRPQYEAYLRKKYKGTRVSPLLDNLLHLLKS